MGRHPKDYRSPMWSKMIAKSNFIQVLHFVYLQSALREEELRRWFYVFQEAKQPGYT